MSNLIAKLPDSSKEKDVKSDGKVHILEAPVLHSEQEGCLNVLFSPHTIQASLVTSHGLLAEDR